MVIIVLTWVNLRGVGESSMVEIVTVWGKLLVLLGLAVLGLLQWAPQQLTAGVSPATATHALAGAAAIFMAYEGFQLLTYDYDDIRDAPRLLPLASISAVLTVIGIALTQKVAHRWISLAGLLGSAAAAFVLIWQLVTTDPLVLVALAAMVLIATVVRPYILRLAQTQSR